MTTRRLTLVFLVASIVAVGLAAYWPAFDGELLFDDIPLLEQTECWRGLHKVPAMFSRNSENPCTYRPVRYVTFALDYSIAGMSATFFHISNFVYHLLTLLAVFALFRRWAGYAASVAMVALWWMHPVSSDAVAYISGRRDLVSTLFFVLAFLQLSRPSGAEFRTRHGIVGLGLFGLALGAKEMAVTLPAVWLAWEIVQRWGVAGALRAFARRHWLLVAIVLAGGIGFTLYRGVLASPSAMAGLWWGGSATNNFATSLALFGRYLKLIVWPSDLIGDYFPETIELASGFGDWRTLLGILLLAGMIAIIAVALKRGSKVTAFGLIWFLLTFLPVLHLFPHHELFAEHYLYLPTIGLAIAGLPLFERLSTSGPFQRRWLALSIGLLVIVMGGRIYARSLQWQNEWVFYQAAVRHAPNNLRVRYYLGILNTEEGDCEQALPHLEMVIDFMESSSRMRQNALLAYLQCAVSTGRWDTAERTAEVLLSSSRSNPRVFYWRGRSRLHQDRVQEATGDLKRAVVQTQGEFLSAVRLLLVVLNQNRQYEQALEIIERYGGGEPFFCEQEIIALVGLGPTFTRQAFQRLDECHEHHPRSVLLLEWHALMACGDGRLEQARRDVEQLRRLNAPPEVIERIQQSCSAPEP